MPHLSSMTADVKATQAATYRRSKTFKVVTMAPGQLLVPLSDAVQETEHAFGEELGGGECSASRMSCARFPLARSWPISNASSSNFRLLPVRPRTLIGVTDLAERVKK